MQTGVVLEGGGCTFMNTIVRKPEITWCLLAPQRHFETGRVQRRVQQEWFGVSPNRKGIVSDAAQSGL